MTAIHESSPQHHQTIQAHVVEEIMPDQLTEVTDVKEVINQLLPTRKRKPRTKKPNGNEMKPPFDPKTGNRKLFRKFFENFLILIFGILNPIAPKPVIIDGTNQSVVAENGNESGQPKAKKPKTPRDPNSKHPYFLFCFELCQKISKKKNIFVRFLSKEPKSRSQSEQPASCPICGAVIRQSRNLRRHLELRHFSKPGIKKERKHLHLVKMAIY